VGAGTCPIVCNVDTDPLINRDVKCISENLPFKSECFGTVVVFSVLDHVLDDVKLLQEAWRVLEKGGRLLIMQNVLGGREKVMWLRLRLKGKTDQNHLRHYWFDAQLKRKIRKAGFAIGE